MSEPVLTAHDALKWNETIARNWRKLTTEHPEVLTLGCDVARTATVPWTVAPLAGALSATVGGDVSGVAGLTALAMSVAISPAESARR